MKYGVIIHTRTTNFGDDIQTYAASNLLPHVDYCLDREHLDTFRSDNNEVVSAIFAHWWMNQKWNWPPSSCINPLLISMHMNQYTVRQGGSPIGDDWLKGIGADYLKHFGPVGCRDYYTQNYLNSLGIDTWFSACISLALPKQRKIENAEPYVCLVDLPPRIQYTVKKRLQKQGIAVREMTHLVSRSDELSYEDRMKRVEDVLAIYQNALCVVTRRLHVSLPCLAMEVPVLAIIDKEDPKISSRWDPYQNWVHCVSEKDFLKNDMEYDFRNPPENDKTYLTYRNQLIDSVKEFIDRTESSDITMSLPYTDEDVTRWQNELMKLGLDRWQSENRAIISPGLRKAFKDLYTKIKAKIPEYIWK